MTRRGQDRKAQLLRCAEQLFVERGYAETRMVDIARAAGVTKSLLYWYFETKDELFHEIAVDLRKRLRRSQRDAVTGVDDPLARVYLGTVVAVRFLADHHRLFGLVSGRMQGDRSLRATQARSRRLLLDETAAVLAEGQDRGVVRLDEDPVALAHAGAGVVSAFVTLYGDALHQEGTASIPADDAARAAARYVVHAVSADAASAERVIGAHESGRRLRLRPTPT